MSREHRDGGGDAFFEDRRDAGRRLARELKPLADGKTLVLGLPRGGMVVAAEIARELGAPLDALVVRKIGAPDQPELALGAVIDGAEPQVILNEDIIKAYGIDNRTLERAIAAELTEVERRRKLYRAGRPSPEIAGKTVILVDDGIATGASVRVALKALRLAEPEKLILAVPVAPRETLSLLAPDVDEIICLSSPDHFMSVGAHYRDFEQTTDAEVIELLREGKREHSAGDGPARETGT